MSAIPLPASWVVARDQIEPIALFLEPDIPSVSTVLRKAAAESPPESDHVIVFLSADEATAVWAAYERGREIASADV